VSKTLHRAAALLQETIEKASAASDQHAKSLVAATRWLVLVTVALVIVTAVHGFIAALPILSAGKSPNNPYTLYRSSAVGGEMRIHVATFDAAERQDYNENNCEIARKLFSAQPAVGVKYWCERGQHRR
jgi:hypothetical protein